MLEPRTCRPEAVAFVMALLLASGAASAQIPEAFSNLQVLPASTTRPQLLATMRAFSESLGVRCQHCHSGPEGPDLSKVSFADDQKGAKVTARAMMRMVQTINRDLLPSFRGRGSEVTCLTCHRGLPSPKTLTTVMSDELARSDVGGAAALYRRLRAENYGNGKYDFSERSLLAVAETAMARKDSAGATAILDLNLEFFPESATTHFMLGEAQRSAGQLERAKASYERALKLDPSNPLAKARLQQLSKPQ